MRQGGGSAEYISGGYYLTRRSTREAYMSPELVPEWVVSASGCICKFFPDDWSIDWTSDSPDERIREAAGFGISTSVLPRVTAWATAAFSHAFGWPNVFYTLDGARQAHATLLPEDLDVIILGLGLHKSDVEDFLITARPPDQKPGFAPVGETGISQCVNAGKGIDETGDPVGFELLATESGLLTCSWLCNGLEKECATRLGVRTNSSGLVQTHAEALRCAEFISRDDVGAEPGLWLPWLLTIYPDTLAR